MFNLGDVMVLSVMRCEDAVIDEVTYPSPPTPIDANATAEERASAEASFLQSIRPQYRFPSFADLPTARDRTYLSGAIPADPSAAPTPTNTNLPSSPPFFDWTASDEGSDRDHPQQI